MAKGKWAILDGEVERSHRAGVIETIFGGTNEIQRTIIAQRGVGLPRV